jgi:hypothetical protein
VHTLSHAKEPGIYRSSGCLNPVAEMSAVVHEFPKNRREVVRTSLQEFEGRQVVDLRVWAPRRSDGEMVPCPKGLTVDRALLPDLERAVRAAREAVEGN